MTADLLVWGGCQSLLREGGAMAGLSAGVVCGALVGWLLGRGGDGE